MARSKTNRSKNTKGNSRGNYRKSEVKTDHSTKPRRPKMEREDASSHLEERENDPRWYFTDEKLADQVSQLSFQNLAGYPINYDGKDFDVPNIVRIYLNPSPGVQLSTRYGTPLAQNSAINMAAFRFYSKLSAFTGRTQSYAPQDVAVMVLAMGELISQIENVRRMFGIVNVGNMRNRDYPKTMLNFGLVVDADDLCANYSNYRTQFNTLITLVNQLPIPKNIAYFDKCAALYEHVYLDAPSSMAQSIVCIPFSTWVLDEASYSGGTVLKTYPVCVDSTYGQFATPPTMAWYLNLLSTMIGAMLNSTTLNVVYTDILNYASKQGMEFWKFEYLYENYLVIPEYNANFLLQMHNATIVNNPAETTLVTSPVVVTPYNDVYPDANTNSVYYNPAFHCVLSMANGKPSTGSDALIDMLTDSPTLTDRVEVTRFTSISGGTYYTPSYGTQPVCSIDTTLPDHYVVMCRFETQTNNLTNKTANTTLLGTHFRDISALVANIDWAPRFWEIDSSANYTGRYTGDVNFYTLVDEQYLRKLHDFVGLALYDLR